MDHLYQGFVYVDDDDSIVVEDIDDFPNADKGEIQKLVNMHIYGDSEIAIELELDKCTAKAKKELDPVLAEFGLVIKKKHVIEKDL